MFGKKSIACVIPARLASTRFPRKILAPLKQRPLIQWVWEAANSVSFFDEVVFAIDSEETASVIRTFGGKYFMTSKDCLTGTDRLVELQKKQLIKADVWINWQADEPFITERIIKDLLQDCEYEGDIWTLKKKISALDAECENTTKVVCDFSGFALYFSRHPVPFYKKASLLEEKIYYKHIGLYAFSNKALEQISTFSACHLEEVEQLEQLRFQYYGLKVKVHETCYETIGIDLPEHLVKAEQFLDKQQVFA